MNDVNEEKMEELMKVFRPLFPNLSEEQLRKHVKTAVEVGTAYKDPLDAEALKQSLYDRFPHLKSRFEEFFKELK